MRFIPGTIVAGRYRIVSLAGRGGMGEVYRADDLKLGQPVALKFLPSEIEKDQARVGLLLNEVRLARQIAHPNVCRVYDVGEVDGQHYISMEYVDGENLSSLLRQIGRLPRDKAIQIARQLCAGLAAAHEEGILHRDLKPANVMLDSRGRARITDFGLAALVAGAAPGSDRAGTPAYMAPEYATDGRASAASDIYSLGVVLYELFTGKHPYKASSQAELVRMQRESTPTAPSSLIDDMDPVAERVILRCLESQPDGRPSSALAVSAALPGGDPLAAALAAGETPSPEMVAAAGPSGGLAPWLVVTCVIVSLVGMLGATGIGEKLSLHTRVHWFKSYEALKENGREHARNLGYDEPYVDRTGRFHYDIEELLRLGEPGRPASELLDQPGQQLVYFDYYQSNRALVPYSLFGRVTPTDPAFAPGDIRMKLGLDGELAGFWAMPPHAARPRTGAPEFEWPRLFAAAGLDIDDFEPTEPTLIPPLMADTRRAWTGTLPDQLDRKVRIEAGSLHGKLVYFEQVYASSRYWEYSEPEAEAGASDDTATRPASSRPGREGRVATVPTRLAPGSKVALGTKGPSRGESRQSAGTEAASDASPGGDSGVGSDPEPAGMTAAGEGAEPESAEAGGEPSAAETADAAAVADAGNAAAQGVSFEALEIALLVLIVLFLLLALSGALLLVVRNLRLGRGDRRGALRLAVFVVLLRLMHWLLTGHHVAHPGELYMLVVAFSGAVSLGLMVWVLYLAIEPYIRRLWPQTMVSWTRLLSGRMTDPLVGRDVLVGTAVSLGLTLLALPLFLTVDVPTLPVLSANALRGGRFAVGELFLSTLQALAAALGLLVFFVVLRMVLRRTWIAGTVFGLLYGTYVMIVFLQAAKGSPVEVPLSTVALGFTLGALNVIGMIFLLTRFGLVAFTGFFFVSSLLNNYPLTLDISAPYFGISLIGPIVAILVVGFAAWTALAGRPLFTD